MDADSTVDSELDIAVVGMACRFPGADGPREFARLVLDGAEAVRRFSAAELAESGVSDDILSHPDFVGAAGVVPDGNAFDDGFFGYTPAEAAMLDPQQRMFLECAWHALEDAGHDPATFPGDIGVMAGQTVSTHLAAPLEALLTTPMDVFQQMSANDKDFLPTRVSHKLGLTGPSINVQSACSTSLVAIHVAAQSLLNGECDMALAGAVSWTALRPRGYRYQPGGIMSPDGHCRPFDQRAGGFVPADGVGIVVLRGFADALADGDRIYAVLKGSAVNNDGADKVGYTAPGMRGQERVITQALANAGVHPDTVGHVEAHGTATRFGDPVEVAALTRAYRSRGGTAEESCVIGSVKANIGHTDVAAGVAGFIKTALLLHRGCLPPSVNLEQVSDEIAAAGSPFRFERPSGRWEPLHGARRAAVSSFGIGGTNAHAILEQAPEQPRLASSRPWHLLALSARDDDALDRSAQRWAQHLESEEADFADVCWTSARRSGMNRRLAVVATDRETAVARLREEATPAAVRGNVETDRPDATVFLFPGGGAHYAGMGAGLYRDEPVFRCSMDEGLGLVADPALRERLRCALFERCTNGGPDPFADPEVGLPALLLTELALGDLLIARGLSATTFAGHSLGEYAAACFAGVFSRQDALSVVVKRGQILAGIEGGAMLSVAASEQDVRPHLADGLSLSVVNGPRMCVVSGHRDDIAAVHEIFTGLDIDCRRVPIATAAHSRLVDPALPEFRAFLEGIELRAPSRPLLSNVTGRPAGAEVTDPQYWVDQLRGTVRFAEGLAALEGEQPALIEVGPGTTLTGIVRSHPRTERALVVNTLPHPDDPSADSEVLLRALGRLWASGTDVDLASAYGAETRKRAPLAGYPFARRVHRPEQAKHSTPPATNGAMESLYGASWKRSAARLSASREIGRSAWLVLSDDSALADEVIRLLHEGGCAPIVARLGQHGSRFDYDGTAYVLDPHNRGHHSRLLDAARRTSAENGTQLRILGLWRDELGGERHTGGSRALNGLLGLAHAVGESAATPIELILGTSGAYGITGDEPLAPSAALLAGASHVLPLELDHVRARIVDLDPRETDAADAYRAAHMLLAEGTPRGGADPVVGYRGGHRWTRSFQRLDGGPGTSLLKPGGVYVIVGGLGGVGSHIADHLADRFRARLVLVGRSVADDDRRNSEVLVRQADVTCRERMAEVFGETKARFGAVDGILHAAGAPDGGMLPLLDAEDFAETTRSKVEGARAITGALRDTGTHPDFVALFSSLSSFSSSAGLAGYGAANAFLDTYAVHASRELAVPTLSINWDRWDGTGMAKAVERRHEELTGEPLPSGMDPSRAAEAFAAALEYLPLHQVAVSLRPPDELLTGDAPELPGHHDAATELEPVAPRRRSRADMAGEDTTTTDGERAVLRVWENALGVRGIGVRDNFFALGGHSLLALRIVQRVNASFGTTLTPQDLLRSPTVEGLARHLGDTTARGDG